MYLSKSLIWKNFVGVHDSLRIKHLQTRICKFKRIFYFIFPRLLDLLHQENCRVWFWKVDKVSLLESKAMLGRYAAPGFGILMTPEKSMHACYADEILKRCPTCDCWSTHRGRAQCRPSPPGCTGESWCSGACSRPPRVHNQPPGLHPSLPSAPGF